MFNQYIRGDIVTSFKELPNIGRYQNLHLQGVRRLHITVETLDDNYNTIRTIQGIAKSGSISISKNSLIRRTGELSFVLFDYLYPKEDSILWLTNKIRVYAGIEDLSTEDRTITHFCLGTFHITEPQVKISESERTVSISLEDNMMRWEQEELDNKLVFEVGTPLHTAVTYLMNRYGEFKTDVEFTELTIPYQLEFNEGENIASILETLRDLYMDWECYYDVDGTFVFRRMDIQKPYGEPIAWSFQKNADLITNFSEKFTYKNIKNRVVVVGQMDSLTGITPKAEMFISVDTSPFHESRIGVRKKVITDSSLSTVAQCESKAKYELYKASTFQKQIDISTIPIFFLDANDVIEIFNPNTKLTEHYIIDSISVGLGVGDEMSISASMLYYDHFDVNSSLEKYQASADIVIDGIKNKGWLSLAEERIKEHYGLEGDNSKLIIQFVYEAKYGTTAFVTGFYGSTNQTMTIDLADFENPSGDNGDIGQTKAEFADRILGHEMLHVVMNNAFGINKSSGLPIWFKEGVAEFIHGADERLKASIVDGSSISSTKITNLINMAVGLLNGQAWQSISDSYSAGYVICKYLDTKLSSNGKTYKDLMTSIKRSLGTGDIALREAIIENTEFSTYQEFVDNFSANANNYILLGIRLNIGSDEEDTGSIAGSDHRGITPLTAEAIFDNSKATRGLDSIGFVVEYKRP